MVEFKVDQKLDALVDEEAAKMKSFEQKYADVLPLLHPDLPMKRPIKKSKPSQRNKQRVQYYASPSLAPQSYNVYLYTPGGIRITRVPSSVLGANVLGRAFIGTNRIEILETLHGNAFEEVKRHEINHLLFPYLDEWHIRDKTKRELPFYAQFH